MTIFKVKKKEREKNSSTIKSRFILPTYFLQNARHLITFRKNVRPLIKPIHYSSPWYISYVIFGTSPAFQMREEYVFGKKILFFLNLTSRGVNSGVTQFHTQFTHVSRHFWARNREKKKKVENKCFDNLVSDLWKNGCMCPQNCFEKKCAHKFFLKFYVFLLFCTFF